MRARDKEKMDLGVKLAEGEDAEKIRELCKTDLKYFYKRIMLHGRENYQDSLGTLHDMLFDFLHWEELARLPEEMHGQPLKHSILCKYLPEVDSEGFAKEKWLWFKKLDQEPEIQYGPQGPISDMFNGSIWQGAIVRFAGSGSDKGVYLPRGHLKSTIANNALTLWKIIRDPRSRTMALSLNALLSERFIKMLQEQFETNPAFQSLFGDLGPPPRHEKGNWTQSAITVVSKDRYGPEPTVTAFGLGGKRTGLHVERIVLDDVVGEGNVETDDMIRKTRDYIENLIPIREPDSELIDIGTIWSAADAHSMFLRPEGNYHEDTSFIIGTLLDHEDEIVWPEKFTPKKIAKIRRQYSDDYKYYCQYFNNPYAAKTQGFDVDWLRYYDSVPKKLAIEKKLNLVISIDPASSTHKKSDHTAAIVQGQTPDQQFRYVLDGVADRIKLSDNARIIADLICEWLEVARIAGTTLRVGVENNSFQEIIRHGLQNELRRRGTSIKVEPLKHQHRKKEDRIKRLAAPYSTGSILWPNKGIIKYGSLDDKQYNFMEELYTQYKRFPRSGGKDDILDAQAYAEDMFRPLDFTLDEKIIEAENEFSVYQRSIRDEPPPVKEISRGMYTRRTRGRY